MSNLLKNNIPGNLADHLHTWLFYAFLITFPLTIRKVLVFYPLDGQFNEYTGIYLYLSDILLLLTFLLWVISILCNNICNLSNISTAFQKYIAIVPRGTMLLVPLILVLWSFISLFWADNKNLALFKSLKLAEFYGLYLYLIFNVPRGTLFKRVAQIVIVTGLVQSIIGIWQVVIQKSVGLHVLGESIISPTIAGVAKLEIFGDKFIRAYGLFPHPNILGGFLLVSLIFTLFYKRLFHVEQSAVSSNDIKCSTWNNQGCKVHGSTYHNNVPRGTLFKLWPEYLSFDFNKAFFKFLPLFAGIQILALISSFSKSAIFGLIIAIGYIFFVKNVPRQSRLDPSQSNDNHARVEAGEQLSQVKAGKTSTFAPIAKLFHVEYITRKSALLVLISHFLGFLLLPDKKLLLFKSLEERLLYLNVSRGTILGNPWLGLGNGQFVAEMPKYTNQVLEAWQHQPVHNVFLLIWSELGVVGIVIFIWWLWRLFYPRINMDVPRGTISSGGSDVKQIVHSGDASRPARKLFHVEHFTHSMENAGHLKSVRILQGALLGLIFIMLFDHYLWDIQQGQIVLWLTAGLIAGLARND